MDNKPLVWRETPVIWGVMALALTLTGYLFTGTLQGLMSIWDKRLEYSYGYIIPFITMFLIWQRKDRLERIKFDPGVAGVLVVLAGLGIFLLGRLSTLALIEQYSLIVVLAGIVLSFTGWQAFKVVFIPILFLLFMVPIPSFFISALSQALQLISSELGVWFIRLFDISVYLEGNVIDLGTYKLQVVEACSGLRYLFPLMALGFICAYFYTGAFWKKVVIFISTIPITVVMNSFRIGIIGILVEYRGSAMAEGFLHDFEGWVVFMACLAVLIFEMWVLSRIGNDKLPFSESFGIDMPAPTPGDADIKHRKLSAPFVMSATILLVAIVVVHVMPEKQIITPHRMDFSTFPMSIDVWKGRTERMESIILDTLEVDDYLLGDYRKQGDDGQINLYIAYYGAQHGKKTSHTPKSCLPGGGWEIIDLHSHEIVLQDRGGALYVNRVVIQKGDVKQLVYYWFQQRGRNITNEFLMKWYLFWDAITKNRTDGALVRITALVQPGEGMTDTEMRMVEFVHAVFPYLSDYIPD